MADIHRTETAGSHLIGRIVVSVLFVPAYFRGELLTVYQLLGDRFGGQVLDTLGIERNLARAAQLAIRA